MKNIRICIFIYFSNNTNHYFKQFQMCFLYKNTIKPKNNTTSGVQTGQLSCTLNIPATASATTALFNIRTTFYVLFATRNK